MDNSTLRKYIQKLIEELKDDIEEVSTTAGIAAPPHKFAFSSRGLGTRRKNKNGGMTHTKEGGCPKPDVLGYTLVEGIQSETPVPFKEFYTTALEKFNISKSTDLPEGERNSFLDYVQRNWKPTDEYIFAPAAIRGSKSKPKTSSGTSDAQAKYRKYIRNGGKESFFAWKKGLDEYTPAASLPSVAGYKVSGDKVKEVFLDALKHFGFSSPKDFGKASADIKKKVFKWIDSKVRAKNEAFKKNDFLNQAEKHQISIAKKTLKMAGPMASMMGGMSKEEAKEILKKYNIKFNEDLKKNVNENFKVGATFNHEGATWEVIKVGVTQSKVRAVTKSLKGKETTVDNKIISKSNESVNESFTPQEIATIKSIVTKEKKLIGLSPSLNKAGFKTDFIMHDMVPAHIKIKKGNSTYILINKRYVDKPDWVVGDIAGGLDESITETKDYMSRGKFEKLAKGAGYKVKMKDAYGHLTAYELTKNGKVSQVTLSDKQSNPYLKLNDKQYAPKDIEKALSESNTSLNPTTDTVKKAINVANTGKRVKFFVGNESKTVEQLKASDVDKITKIQFEDIEIVVGESLQESRNGAYYQLKTDETSNTKQKLGIGIRKMNEMLGQIERLVALHSRLKNETGFPAENYWKRARTAMLKIENRLVRISHKIKQLR